MKATKTEMQTLNRLYEGRLPCYGELHDHSFSGGTSDGKCDLATWRKELKELSMDFAAILDHRQVRHMYLPEWEDGIFIGGTEPGMCLTDSKAELGELHYNMIFTGPKPLETLLERFPEYEFSGGPEGHFRYPEMSIARFGELIDAVKELGGFFVHPHPKQLMISDDPCDYWFRDETGIEVFYKGLTSQYTADNYALWTKLLALGKRIWACAGSDWHDHPSDATLTTIYAEEKSNQSYISHLRVGDFVCGSVGIRMAIGETKMGGSCNFDGKKLLISIGDFHTSVLRKGHTYRMDILNDKGVVCSQTISPENTEYYAIETEDCHFYRAEVFDETAHQRIAIGNPIWNN